MSCEALFDAQAMVGCEAVNLSCFTYSLSVCSYLLGGITLLNSDTFFP